MLFKPNSLAQIGSKFKSFTSIDDLVIKWPKNGIANWLNIDEASLVPLNGRTIRAGHFNAYADAIVAMQHWFKANAGRTFLVGEDGSYEECNVAPTVYSLNSLPSSGAIQAKSQFAVVSKSITTTGIMPGSALTNAITVTGYTTIPSGLGADPWNNPTFQVSITPIVEDNSALGWWESTSSLSVAQTKALKNYVISSGVSPSGSAGLNWVFRVDRYQSTTVSSPSTSVTNKVWSLGADTQTFAGYFTNPESNVRALSPYAPYANLGYPGRFTIQMGNAPSTWGGWIHNGTLTQTASSSAFLLFLSQIDYANGKENYSPGGIVFHKDHANVTSRDSGLIFTWHTWSPSAGNVGPYWIMPLPICGPFLRLRQHSNRKIIPSVTTEVLGGVTRNYPQYWGYALRFYGRRANSYRPGTINESAWVGSLAIVKFRYEDFNFDGAVLDNIWFKPVSNSVVIPSGEGGWWGLNVSGQNSDGYYFSNTRPGEYKILAQTNPSINANGSRSLSTFTTYQRPATGLIEPYFAPLHERSWGGLPLASGELVFSKIKFEIINQALSVYTSFDGSTWTLACSALDVEGDVETASTFSVPCGFFNKSFHKQPNEPYNYDSFMGVAKQSPNMVFSNVESYTINSSLPEQSSSITVKLNLLMSADLSQSVTTTSLASGFA